MTVSWPVSFKTEEERKELRDAKPFIYIGSLLVGFVRAGYLCDVRFVIHACTMCVFRGS